MPDYPVAALMEGRARLVPVLHVEEAAHAEPLLAALTGEGVTILEVTLRSAAALDVMRRMRAMNSGALIGAGTITRPEQFAEVAAAGAMFAVSPALTPALAAAAHRAGIPYLPGVCTPSEALSARENGFYELKFFPADLMGGIGWLRHVEPLYPDLRFCPTGGVSDANAHDYLALRNCFAVGGAYVAPRDLIDKGDWKAVAARAGKAVAAVAG